MKRKAIGEIARGAGFPAAIREVQESKEPIVITRGSEPVAVLFPCDPGFERLLLEMKGWSDTLGSMRRSGHTAEAAEYMIHTASLGLMAIGQLVQEGKGIAVTALVEEMVEKTLGAFTKDRAGDKATLGSDLSTVAVGDKTGRRRKSPARS